MPLGTEEGVGPGDIALDRKPAASKKEHSTPHFLAHVYCSQTAGWIQMSLGTEVDLSPSHIFVRWGSSSPKWGTAAAPLFGPCLLGPNGRLSQLLLITCFNKI